MTRGLDEYAEWGPNPRSTSLWSGGVLDINGTDPATFDIDAARGVIVDNATDPDHPSITYVQAAAAVGITVTNLATAEATWVALDVGGAVVQQTTAFTAPQSRTLIVLGALWHPNNTDISSVYRFPKPGPDPALVALDVLDVAGYVLGIGNSYDAGAALNLEISRSGGDVGGTGINWKANPASPNTVTTIASDPVTFAQLYRTGADTYAAAISSAIDPTVYNAGGAGLTAVSNKRWTARYIYVLVNPDQTTKAETIVRVGEEEYQDGKVDLADLLTALPPVPETLKRIGSLRNVLLVLKEATNLDDETEAVWISVGSGGSGGSGGGVSSNGVVTFAGRHTADQIFALTDTVMEFSVVDADDATVYSWDAALNELTVLQSGFIDIEYDVNYRVQAFSANALLLVGFSRDIGAGFVAYGRTRRNGYAMESGFAGQTAFSGRKIAVAAGDKYRVTFSITNGSGSTVVTYAGRSTFAVRHYSA